MSEHIERMKNEQGELRAKLEKLRAFIYTPKFDALTIEQQRLMQHQEHLMTAYMCVLGERIRVDSTAK